MQLEHVRGFMRLHLTPCPFLSGRPVLSRVPIHCTAGRAKPNRDRVWGASREAHPNPTTHKLRLERMGGWVIQNPVERNWAIPRLKRSYNQINAAAILSFMDRLARKTTDWNLWFFVFWGQILEPLRIRSDAIAGDPNTVFRPSG